MGRRYNERARDAVYSHGDQVWFHNPRKRPGKSPKLQSPWEGPYTVVERISAVTYRIAPAGSGRRTKVVHVDRLWRHSGKGMFTWGPRVSDHDNNSDIVGVSDGAKDCDSDASVGGDDAMDGDTDTEYNDDHDSDIGANDGIGGLVVDDPYVAVRSRRQRQPPVWLADYDTRKR